MAIRVKSQKASGPPAKGSSGKKKAPEQPAERKPPKGRRRLDDWINAYMDYVVGSESPLAFHRWAAVGAVAAAMQRKAYMRWGHSVIYPNNYIILVGPSGQTRKAEPVNIARDFVKSLNIPMIPEDTSMEKLIRSFRNSASTFKDGDSGEVMEQSSMAGFLEELSVLIGEQNTRFLAYLTNWYDSRDEWSRTTKHQGDDFLVGVCLNLLAATAPDWIPYMFTQAAIGGGFTSRCLFVVEQRKAKIVADPTIYPIDEDLKAALVHDIEHIHFIAGEYVFEPAAKRAYIEWYERQEKDIADGRLGMSDPYFAGYIARRATHLKKLGMALSASRGGDRLIRLSDWERALGMLHDIEKEMHRVFQGIGKPKYISETDQVGDYVKQRGYVSKAEVLIHLKRVVDDYTLDAAVKVLGAMDMIEVYKKGTKVFYKWTGEGAKKEKRGH